MTTSKAYDYLNRLVSVSSSDSSAALVSGFAYTYDEANQRTRIALADGSYWLYEYDPLGQLTSGKHYWNDGTPVAGQQFEYGFDDIGNRLSTKAGGDETGANLRSAGYAANSLNQYTARDVSGTLDVMGIAHAGASVTVNGQSPSRKGEYYRQELSVNNASAAQWQGITNIASLTGTNQTNTGSLFLPKTQESFSYDADGNLTNDGRFRYVWDAENRLTLAESQSSGPAASKRKVTFEYDGGGRMARRVEYDGSSGSYVQSSDIKFARDGWQLIAEINGSTGMRLRSYTWGLDLSGSLTSAGGVGGLIAVNSASAGTHFCMMDGNGNVVGMVSGVDGTRSCVNEFDPFGQTLRRSGSAATENPFRFSTKRTDEALDLVAYEYRDYSPSLGKWLSRDPIGTKGGLNPYDTSKNNPINRFDVLGLFPGPGWITCTPGAIAALGPWGVMSVEPSSDYQPSTKVSDSVTIIYTRLVNVTFSCPCSCPANTTTVTKIISSDFVVADAPNERGAILWDNGPTGPWPPLDPIEYAIDVINEEIHEPEPASRNDETIVDALAAENMPAPTVLGTLRRKDFPKRWCIWK